MTTDELIEAVTRWGREKKINNADKQTLKLFEECGELCHEICRGRYNSVEVEDAIGDIQVVLIILADILGMDPMKCLLMAYETIKNRTGETKDGSFVKAE